jgi:hypothetical protein
MLTPELEIVVFLSSTFVLGLALGWVLWCLSSKQEISSIASERNFWKKSYEQARLQSHPNQEFDDPSTELNVARPRIRRKRGRGAAAT